MRRPTNSIGALVAASLATAIAWNALFAQTGPHPAPLMAPARLPAVAAKESTGTLAPAQRAQPAETVATNDKSEGKRTRVQLITDIQRELLRRSFYEGAVDGAYGPRMDAAIREFEQAAGLRQSGEPTETLLKALFRSPVKADRTKPAAGKRTDARTETTGAISAAAPSRRIVAVQRALTEFGYGQLKLTGLFDEPTKAAVEKFERERKLPCVANSPTNSCANSPLSLAGRSRSSDGPGANTHEPPACGSHHTDGSLGACV